MNDNRKYSKEEIKTYLKIQSDKKEEQIADPYYFISPNKKSMTLFSKSSNKSSTITKKYEVDKIFTDTNEYSYIYEEITLNCVHDALNGKNYCYFSYGETNGEKHSIIFGGNNSHINLTEKGLFPRLIDALLFKSNLEIFYSIMCVNNNKLIDLSKFAIKDKIPSLTQEELLNHSIDINQSSEIINRIEKISVKDSKDFISSLELYNNLFSHLYLIEPNSNCDLYSCSDFVYVIYINNNNNTCANGNSINSLISTITFCELAGNEMKTTQVSNPKIIIKDSIKNTKAVINNTNTIESLKKTIRNFCQLKSYSKHKRITNFQVENAKLLIVLQRLCFSIPMISYIAIGSINVNIQDNINETLQFLFDLRKISIEKETNDLSLMTNFDEVNKDDLIYKLQIKCKEQEVDITELNNRLESKNERFEKYKQLYHCQIDKLKSSFAFEGDVALLIGGNEYIKEARNARKISHSIANLAHEKNKNEILNEKISDLNKKISKLTNENELLRSDQSMLSFFHHQKDENESEKERLRINLDNFHTINKLKEENTKLILINKELKKEIESKFNVIQNFNTQLTHKQDDLRNKDEMRKENQKEFEKKYKEEYKLLQLKYDKEIAIVNKKNEAMSKRKEDYMVKHNSIYDELMVNHEKSIEKYTREVVYLYEIIHLMIDNYRKEFGWKSTENMSSIYYNYFITSRDNYMKFIDLIDTSVNIVNFPITLKEYNSKRGLLIKNNLYQELNIEGLKLKKITKKTATDNDEKSDNAKLQKLLKENQTLRNQVIKLNELIEVNEAKWSVRETDKLAVSNNELAKKLEDMTNENQKNKIIIATNEKIIIQLNAENCLIKTALKKKATTDSLNYPSTLISLRTRNNKKYLNKTKSKDNIISPHIFIRPRTSSLKY